MRLVTLPGVFRPISDTWLLADALDREPLPAGRARARPVLGQRRAGRPRRARRPVARGRGGRRLAPRRGSRSASTRRSTACACDAAPRRSVRRVAGRAVRRDRLQPAVRAGGRPTRSRPRARAGVGRRPRRPRAARPHLRRAPRGTCDPAAWSCSCHSSLLGYEPTAAALGGLEVDVAASERGPLGPLMRARRAAGLIAAGRRGGRARRPRTQLRLPRLPVRP